MDEEQTNKMREYGYETLIEAQYSTDEILYKTITHWYKDSCFLRFVQAVETAIGAKGTGEPSFSDVISQGE
jgi:hypothetical protein